MTLVNVTVSHVVCSHGKARTQLMLVPRSVQRPQNSAVSSSTQSSDTASTGNDAAETKKMTNADFRKMLLH